MPIQNATLSDLPSLAACIDQVARERRFLARTAGFSLEETKSFHQNLIAAGGVQLVAVDTNDNNRVFAWADVRPLQSEGLNHVGSLGMGVLSTHRRRGWGRGLISRLLPLAFEKLERIELEVFSSNQAAIQLYKQFGFVEDVLLFGLLKEEFA